MLNRGFFLDISLREFMPANQSIKLSKLNTSELQAAFQLRGTLAQRPEGLRGLRGAPRFRREASGLRPRGSFGIDGANPTVCVVCSGQSIKLA